MTGRQLNLRRLESEQHEVSPKDNPPEIQSDPIAACSSWGGRLQIQEVDGNSQQPKKETDDEMFAPDGLHKAFCLPNNEIRRFALLRLAQRVRPSPHWAESAKKMNLAE